MRVVTFRNPLSRALGLMFRRPAPQTLYVFRFGRPVRHQFHMWFVFSPIDIFFLDARGRVVAQKRGFTPFMTYRPASRYAVAVEAAPGVVRDPASLWRLVR